jgi:hypothetical protein
MLRPIIAVVAAAFIALALTSTEASARFGGGGGFRGGGFRHFGGFHRHDGFRFARFHRHRRFFYGGYYPYYYHPYCRVIWTYYGPRRICGYHYWHRWHHWRRHYW